MRTIYSLLSVQRPGIHKPKRKIAKGQMRSQECINCCPRQRQRYVNEQSGHCFIQSETSKRNQGQKKRSLI